MTDPAQTILAFAAEQHLIGAGQVALVIETTTPQAEQQLIALARDGLIRLHRGAHRPPVYFQITGRGLRSIGSPLPEPGDIERALTRRVMCHHDMRRLHPTDQHQAD